MIISPTMVSITIPYLTSSLLAQHNKADIAEHIARRGDTEQDRSKKNSSNDKRQGHDVSLQQT